MTWILAATTGALFGLGVYHLLQRNALKLVLGTLEGRRRNR